MARSAVKKRVQDPNENETVQVQVYMSPKLLAELDLDRSEREIEIGVPISRSSHVLYAITQLLAARKNQKRGKK